MGWNGLDLVNDFSAELGDTSSGYKTKVLRWISQGVTDICTSHNWPFLREKGKVILTADQDIHSLVSTPSAPTLAALNGGGLALVPYQVLVTFYEAQADVESIAGTASASHTPAGANLSITVSAIPVSTNTLVTARKVYVSKNSGPYQYHSTISNNTATTTNITSDPTSLSTPPDRHPIHMLDGDIFIESSRVLSGTTVQDINYKTNASSSSGTPQCWAPVNEEEILVYPKPTANTTASFWYFKRPAQIFGVATSVPQMPDWLYEDLRRYVLWRGFDYRDRAGKESKEITYRENLKVTISRKGKPLKRAGRIRSVTPDSDGYVG